MSGQSVQDAAGAGGGAGAAAGGSGLPTRELDCITITGLHVHARHGVHDHERASGQDFFIDAEVWLDARVAAAGDDLTATAHYGDLMRALHAVAREPVYLLETLAERLAAAALRFEPVRAVRITVHKPQAPVKLRFDDLAVSVLRLRDDAPVALGGDQTVPKSPVFGETPAKNASAAVFRTFSTLASSAETGSIAEGVASGDSEAGVADVTPADAADAARAAKDGVVQPGGAAKDGVVQPGGAGEDGVARLGGAAATREPEQCEPERREPERRGPRARAIIALGANLGDRAASILAAFDEIEALPGVWPIARSRLYETPALTLHGVDEEAPAYLNAAMSIATSLDPHDLLAALHGIEAAHGRVRSERWASRTLDLDLIDHGALTLHDDTIELPHPRAFERAFVLVPWSEIEPEASLPGRGPVRELLAAAHDRVTQWQP